MTTYELKMAQFIDTLFAPEKPEWWEDVYAEYIGLRENKSTKFLLSLMKEVSYASNKLFITAKCLSVLWELFEIGRSNEELVKELKLQGCKGQFDIRLKSRYESDMKAAETHSKRLVDALRRKEKELTDYQAKYSTEITRDYFEDMNIALWHYLKDRVDNNIVSVAEWCKLCNKYEAYCEVQNAMKPENNLMYGRK